MDSLSSHGPVIVVGGGLAGIAAALRLAAAGQRVHLYERNRQLGGRAGSHPFGPQGELLDVGQHVFLRCCTRYTALLEELDVQHLAPIAEPLRLPVIDAKTYPTARSVAKLASARLPATVHMAPSFLRYHHLTLGERLRAARTLMAIGSTDRSRSQWERESFGGWLRARGESEGALKAFWNVITVPTLNSSVDEVSAHWGFMLFQEALLKSRTGSQIGVPVVPLSQLLNPAAARLAQQGGEVRRGQRIIRIVVEKGRVQGVQTSQGRLIAASRVVAAVNSHDLLRLLPPHVAAEPFFAGIANLTGRPILDLHLGYRRPVTPPWFHFGAFLNSPVQWLFAHDSGRRLAVSISNPGRLWEESADEIVRTIGGELSRLFGCSEPAWARICRQRHATFSLAPGEERHRRAQRTPVPGLYLAGDWTKTGWPATMEGAVRSGEAAASAILGDAAANGRHLEAPGS